MTFRAEMDENTAQAQVLSGEAEGNSRLHASPNRLADPLHACTEAGQRASHEGLHRCTPFLHPAGKPV